MKCILTILCKKFIASDNDGAVKLFSVLDLTFVTGLPVVIVLNVKKFISKKMKNEQFKNWQIKPV